MNAQNNTPASRNEEAVKTALLPFAKLGGPWDSFGFKAFPDLEDEIVIFENSGAFITAADVRNARKALAAPRAAIDAREQEEQRLKTVSNALVQLDGLYAGLCDESPERPGWLRAALRVARGEQLGVAVNAAPSEALSPATVAQPVEDYVPRVDLPDAVVDAVAHHANHWPLTHGAFGESFYRFAQELKDEVIARLPLHCFTPAAQPCASQGCGGAVSDEAFERFFYGSFRDAGFTVGGHPVSSTNARHIWDAALSTAKSGGGATPEGGGE